MASGHPETRTIGWEPSLVRGQAQAVEGVVGEQEAAVEIDPLGERCDDRRCGDADGSLLHAAKKCAEPERPSALEHRTCRPDATDLRKLHVHARDDAIERVEIL